MRKNLYLGLIACAALTMTGCSNDEVSYSSSKQEDRAIQFDTYLGKNVQGRGTINNDNALHTSGFGVTAFYTGQTSWSALTPAKAPDFMYNQKVTYSTNWTYDPVKYWPTTQGDKISFFAYAPYSDNTNISTSDNSDTGTPTVTVTYPTNLTQMVDFVAASVIDQEKTATVPFDLKHKMTRVGIQAKVSEKVFDNSNPHKKTTVVIKSVKLNAAAESGELYISGIYTFASTTDGAGTWNPTLATEALDLETILDLQTIEKGTVEESKYSTQGIALTESETPKNLFQADQYLFLVPVVEGLTADKATATIEYDIVTEDNALEKTYSCTSATKTISLPTETLKQGTAYTYTFTINVATVDVTATISDNWNTTGTGSGDVDYGSTDNN